MRRTLALVAAVVVLAGFEYVQDDPPPGAELVAADSTRYPPPDRDRIADALASTLRETEVTLTRAALADRGDDRYEISATGNHLALYVEPSAGASAADYATGLVELTDTLGSEVLGRWPELSSFDICQMPVGGVAVSDEVPFTLLDMTRDAFEQWQEEGADLAGLISLSQVVDAGLRLQLTEPVRDDAHVAAAAAKAHVDVEELGIDSGNS